MYNYYWGYTAAQIELAIVDGPVVVYKKDKKEKVKPSGAAVERAALAYEQETKENGGKIKVDFSDFNI